MRCAEWATRGTHTAAGTGWWLCWWRWAFAEGCVCVLTACLHALRSSLDLDRAFISKWMTLNWPGKYTGCLLIIGCFFSLRLCFDTDAQIRKVYKQQDTTKLEQRHALARAALTITVMSSKWQTIHGFAAPGSKAGLQLPTKDSDKEFWDIFSLFSLSILLSTSHHLFFTLFQSVLVCPLALLTPQREGESQTRVLVS